MPTKDMIERACKAYDDVFQNFDSHEAAIRAALEAALISQGDVGEIVERLRELANGEAADLIVAQAAQIASLTAQRDEAIKHKITAQQRLKTTEESVTGWKLRADRLESSATAAEAEVRRLREAATLLLSEIDSPGNRISILSAGMPLRAALAEGWEVEHG